MVPPLALDIDGTLTTPDGRIDPRVFERLPTWDAPVVFATGKAFPYPVALATFLGLPIRVIAENGGVVHADGETSIRANPAAPEAAAEAFLERGGSLGWGTDETVNRWRETEVATAPDADESLLRSVTAATDAVEVVDTGYAFHLKSPTVSKGDGLRLVAETLDLDPEAFVAIGDSENDVSTFGVAGRSYAVANADQAATAAADVVLEESFADGTMSVLDTLRAAADR